MQPENNQNFPPPDYLDQIAPQEIKTPVLFIKKPVFIVILFSLFTIVMVVSLLASLPSKTESSQHLAARLKATEELTEDANNKIKSNKLRAINSNLKTNLLNMINDITNPISEQGINIDNLDKKIVASESNVKLLEKLEEARLNIKYDTTYSIEMKYQVNTIINLMKEIRNNTNSESMKTFIDGALKNLESIEQQLSDFNSTLN
ncbi:MAG TPA: hypothetical protein PLO25_02480 [Candidatus Saccharibacteria bacterium]|nr:hypothetical protein [Candidatus Saccharibacteria bacterium]